VSEQGVLEQVRARLALRADCGSCLGLCCVALPFAASADFAIDKAAGVPCPNLRADLGCSIHRDLRQRGFPGCASFDCFGAGQKVTQQTFAGRDWRRDPRTAGQMFDALAVMRQLHELLWYLTDALAQPRARKLSRSLRAALDDTERLTRSSAEALLAIDVPVHRDAVDTLLLRTSELVRAGYPERNHRRADLVGARLKGADLRGADLRGAYLIGADLRGADLTAADLIGTDVRNADLGGADLAASLFVTQAQIEAARGDDVTRLPPSLTRPVHWSATAGRSAGRRRGHASRR
jgi:Pentapeptide repeats (8 copies)